MILASMVGGLFCQSACDDSGEHLIIRDASIDSGGLDLPGRRRRLDAGVRPGVRGV
jgi:hypothetical protein